MNNNLIDKIFQEGLAKEQQFDRQEPQWNIIKKGIIRKRKFPFFWTFGSAIVVFLLVTFIFNMNQYSEETNIKNITSVTPSSNNETNETFAIVTDSQIEQSDNAFSNHSLPGYEKQTATEITNIEKNTPTNIKNQEVILEVTNSKRSNQILNAKNSNLDNTSLGNYNSTTNNNRYKDYSQSSTSLKYPFSEASSQTTSENINNPDKINSALSKYELLNDEMLPKYGIQLISYQSKNKQDIFNPILYKTNIQKRRFDLYSGIAISTEINTEIDLNNPYAVMFGIRYRLNNWLILNSSYSYNNQNVQVRSNFNNYGITHNEPYGGILWDNTNISGENHRISVGLNLYKDFNDWRFFTGLNSNFQYLRNTNEEHNIETAYQLITINEIVNNTFQLASVSPGVGIQYNYGRIGISTEYEYFFHVQSLYAWKGVQNINILLHYNL